MNAALDTAAQLAPGSRIRHPELGEGVVRLPGTKHEVVMSAKTAPTSISHDEASAAMFRNDPQLAAEFLNAVLADGDNTELLVAMRQLTLAFGGVANVAKMAELHSKTLYKTLSKDGNPELATLTQHLKVMGQRLAIEPLPAVRPRRRTATAQIRRRRADGAAPGREPRRPGMPDAAPRSHRRRAPMPEKCVEELLGLGNYSRIEEGLSDAAAQDEVRRCLRCDFPVRRSRVEASGWGPPSRKVKIPRALPARFQRSARDLLPDVQPATTRTGARCGSGSESKRSSPL